MTAYSAVDGPRGDQLFCRGQSGEDRIWGGDHLTDLAINSKASIVTPISTVTVLFVVTTCMAASKLTSSFFMI